MKPPAFTYHRPRSLEDTLDVLGALGERGKVLAGGQSLVPLMSMRLAAPERARRRQPRPGSRAAWPSTRTSYAWGRWRGTARSSTTRRRTPRSPLLRQALRHVAHPTIRNRGTTVGSLVHADPAAEMPAVLMLLDGLSTLRSSSGTRDVAAGTSSRAAGDRRATR